MKAKAKGIIANIHEVPLITLLLMSGCTSSPSSGTDTTVTKNFSQSMNGWKTPSGESLTFTINPSMLISGSATSFQCRAGLKTLINSQFFSDCSSGTFVPSKTAGTSASGIKYDNGTYTFEIQAKNADNTVYSHSEDFYVHPSLDGVPTCTSSISDSEYFQAAANYLDMSKTFGASTSLDGPFKTVQFDRINLATNSKSNVFDTRHVVSLRKRLKANGNNSLILLTRQYAKWFAFETPNGYSFANNTIMQNRSFLSNNAVHPYVVVNNSNRHSNYQTTDSACEVTPATRRMGTTTRSIQLVSNGGGGYVVDQYFRNFGYSINGIRYNDTATQSPAYTDSGMYNLLSSPLWTGRRVGNKLRSRGGQAVEAKIAYELAHAVRTTSPMFFGSRLSCDAIVFNANAKAICFHHHSVAEPLVVESIINSFSATTNIGVYASNQLSHAKVYEDASFDNMVSSDPTTATRFLTKRQHVNR